MTYNGSISGSGSLSKLGSGTLTLNGANNYRGNTIIAAGTLVAGATDALSPMSNLLIDDGASVILDFGGDGDDGNFALGGVGEPVPVLAAPASRRPMYRRCRTGALARLRRRSPGWPDPVARKEVLKQRKKQMRVST